MVEVWKDIPGYEGEYQVSNLGNVRSCDRWIYPNGKGKWLKKGQMRFKFQAPDGYVRTALSRNGRTIHFPIHRLVAMAFIPNPLNLPFINHKDECKSNNFVFVYPDGSIDERKSNLEWCTAKYNCNYGTKGQMASISLKKVKVGIPIIQMSLNGEYIKEYQNSEKAAEENGFWRENISSCCRGEKISAHGYLWRYKDEQRYVEAQKRLMKKKRYRIIGVSQETKDGKVVAQYSSIKEAALKTNINETAICMVCAGKRNIAGGYKWQKLLRV